MSDLPTATRVSDPGIRALYRLENRWQAWLDVEAALAQAQAELGIIPAEAAEAIAAQGAARAAGPRAHRRGLRPHRPHARAAGLGARRAWSASRTAAGCTGAPRRRTSPRPAICWCCARRTRSSCARSARSLTAMADLAERSADMPMAGRTHGQHAVPATFGYKVAVWIDELLRHVERLRQARAAPVRRHAGRRRRHVCLARQAGAAGAGGHRPRSSASAR